MRARKAAALLCAMGLLSACTQVVPTGPGVDSDEYPPELTAVTIAAATIAPTQFTLAAPVEAYSVTWEHALKKLGGGFDATVGVAALAEGDDSSFFCKDNPPPRFDINGPVVLYCQAAHEGPDPLPYAGMILVSNKVYQEALRTGNPESDQVAKSQGTALLMAAGYARHVVAELRTRGLLSQSQAERLGTKVNCVAGLTLRSYIPGPIDNSWWDKALAFIGHFTIDGMSAWNPPEIADGFNSGSLEACLAR